jgi:hypothetical protein
MNSQDNNLPQLTSTAIETLQQAFVQCSHGPTEGLILAALVKIKQVHDALNSINEARYEADPSEYCTAI